MATTPRAPRRSRDVDAALLSRPHRATLGLAASLILVEAVLELARPWPLKLVVDQGLGGQPFPGWAGSLVGAGVGQLALLAGVAVVVLSLAGGLAGAGSTLLVGRVAERNVTVELTDAARDLLGDLGYDPTYGARPLKRIISKRLVDPLALGLLKGEFAAGDRTVAVRVGISFVSVAGARATWPRSAWWPR